MNRDTVVAGCDTQAEVAAWSSWLRRTRSAATVKRWLPVIGAFAEWLEDEQVALDVVRGTHLENGFLGWWGRRFELQHGRVPADKTWLAVHAALASFFAWLDRAERGPARNPMTRVDRPKARRKRLDALSGDELERLLTAGPGRPQQRIAVWFLRWSGLRVGEFVQLRQRDVDLAAGFIYVRQSKTDAGVRDVPIAPELRPEIVRWLRYLDRAGQRDPHRPFACTRVGTAQTPQQVERAVKIAGLRADVRPHRDRSAVGRENHSGVTCHQLRRTFATDLLHRGLDIESVSALLGHADVRVTQQAYAELRRDEVARRVRGPHLVAGRASAISRDRVFARCAGTGLAASADARYPAREPPRLD